MSPSALALMIVMLLHAASREPLLCKPENEKVSVSVELQSVEAITNNWVDLAPEDREKDTETQVILMLKQESRLSAWSFEPSSPSGNHEFRLEIIFSRTGRQLKTALNLKRKDNRLLGGIPIAPAKTDIETSPALSSKGPKELASWLMQQIENAGQEDPSQRNDNPFNQLFSLLSDRIPIAFHGHWLRFDEQPYILIPLPKNEYMRRRGFHLKCEKVKRDGNNYTQDTLSDIYATSTGTWVSQGPNYEHGNDSSEEHYGHIKAKPEYIEIVGCSDVSEMSSEELFQYIPNTIFFTKIEDVWSCSKVNRPDIIPPR